MDLNNVVHWPDSRFKFDKHACSTAKGNLGVGKKVTLENLQNWYSTRVKHTVGSTAQGVSGEHSVSALESS